MTPEQLKASIIFSALQGKLVEQIDEEPSVDTSKIKSKKQKQSNLTYQKNGRWLILKQ